MNNKNLGHTPPTPEQESWQPPERFEIKPANEQGSGESQVQKYEVPGSNLLPEHLNGNGLNVLRSSGEMDTGTWTVEGAGKYLDEETGEEFVVVGVTAPAPPESGYKSLHKNVRLTELEKWNPAPEEEELVATPQEIRDTLGRDNLDNEPVASPGEIRAAVNEAQFPREVGSVALVASGAEQPPKDTPELISKVPLNPEDLEQPDTGEILEDLRESFGLAKGAILDAISKHGPSEYYRKPRYQEKISRGAAIKQELAELEQKVADGSFEDTKFITLYGGIQSRNVADSIERSGNNAVEWLYHNLCEKAGLGEGRDYYDIEKMAKQANEKSPYKAIKDSSGNVQGVRLDMGGGVFADFNIGNLSDPENTEKKMSSVRLEVKPSKQ